MAWNRREMLRGVGLGAVSTLLAREFAASGLFAEEPHLKSGNKLSDAEEIELGRRFAAALEREQPIVSNGLIDNYLGKVVAELGGKGQRPNLPYSIKLVNSKIPNVLSLPGGFLYINRGMVETVGSEGELVALLAHQVGHVAGRHGLNQLLAAFSAQSLLKPVLDNLNQKNAVIDDIFFKLGGASAVLNKMRFHFKEETEADLLGFYEMQRAGWDPSGFLKLFAHLDKLEGAYDEYSTDEPPPFLSHHPPNPERITAIRRELKLVTIPAVASSDSTKFKVLKSALALLVAPGRNP